MLLSLLVKHDQVEMTTARKVHLWSMAGARQKLGT